MEKSVVCSAQNAEKWRQESEKAEQIAEKALRHTVIRWNPYCNDVIMVRLEPEQSYDGEK